MLPWLKPKSANVGLIVTHRKPDAPGEGHEENSNSSILEQCAKDLIQAVQEQDHKGVAQALEDAFYIFSSQPHTEGEHTNEEEA